MYVLILPSKYQSINSRTIVRFEVGPFRRTIFVLLVCKFKARLHITEKNWEPVKIYSNYHFFHQKIIDWHFLSWILFIINHILSKEQIKQSLGHTVTHKSDMPGKNAHMPQKWLKNSYQRSIQPVTYIRVTGNFNEISILKPMQLCRASCTGKLGNIVYPHDLLLSQVWNRSCTSEISRFFTYF